MPDKNISPVGWYIGSYLIRFVELNHGRNEDPEQRFVSWENTLIVRANDLDEAYDKIVENAGLDTRPYKGGPHGVPVQWIFEGVTELIPIYEELRDGAEVMWLERKPTKLKNLRKTVRQKGEFGQ